MALIVLIEGSQEFQCIHAICIIIYARKLGLSIGNIREFTLAGNTLNFVFITIDDFTQVFGRIIVFKINDGDWGHQVSTLLKK